MSVEGHRKPTELAQMQFSAGANAAFPGIHGAELKPKDIANVLHKLAAGLEAMAIGLRATYNRIDQLEELVKTQNAMLLAILGNSAAALLKKP